MLFSKPTPFRQAILSVAARKLMPTSMTSAELGQLNQQILSTSFFSAQNTITDLLQPEKDAVLSLVEGTTDFAQARLAIKNVVREIGYQPAEGERGTITDLGSNQRINLVLQTNKQINQGFGWFAQGQDQAVLDAFPAQELYRAEDRKEKRDWVQRFRLAGEASGSSIGDGWIITPEGLMFALKNHPIWAKLGSRELFPDALGNNYAPFAWGTGMDTQDTSRRRALDLGIMQEDTKVEPLPLPDYGNDAQAA